MKYLILFAFLFLAVSCRQDPLKPDDTTDVKVNIADSAKDKLTDATTKVNEATDKLAEAAEALTSEATDKIAEAVNTTTDSSANTTATDLKSADNIDLKRLTGHWYVIARIPTDMDKDAKCSQFNFTLGENKTADIEGAWKLNLTDADFKTDKLKARIAGKDSELKVKHGSSEKEADYFILSVDDDYEDYLIVGEKNKLHLLIFSRDDDMDKDDFEELKPFLNSTGFPLDKIEKVDQSCGSYLERGFLN